MSINKPFEFFIQWHLSEACNLSCKHCYQGGRGSDEMPLAEIKKTAAEAADMIREWSTAYGISFSPSMNITGGEPFLRSDLFDILQAVREQGFEVYLLTNGTLVDKARARTLAELGVSGVQVSIEGPEEVHDAIRGRGSFTASASGIKQLVDAGVPVTLNVTLSALNARHVGRIVAFGSQAGADRIGFSRLVPSGRGRTLLPHMLPESELRQLYASLLSLELSNLTIVTGDPIAAQMNKPVAGDAGSVAMSGCAAALAGLTIMPDGDVLPCRRLPISLGNVRRDSLRELWMVSPVLEALRDRSRYRGRCGACKRWAVCRGCRAIAYAWSRSQGNDDFLADDPQCFLPNGDN
jgi:radical SAM protein with 4Fe4S-binding SPASM domain